jgi:hypothetical protein
MIDFPTLFPSLVKYIPNWMEKFYPRMAQFARGEGYPCGNKGVFIPRRNKCWTHPKTGNKLKQPLTYQKYQEAKEKSQKSRTEKGRTALQDREQGFRDKAREKAKGWQNKTPDSGVSERAIADIGKVKSGQILLNEKERYRLQHDRGMYLLNDPKLSARQGGTSKKLTEKEATDFLAEQYEKGETKYTPNREYLGGVGHKLFIDSNTPEGKALLEAEELVKKTKKTSSNYRVAVDFKNVATVDYIAKRSANSPTKEQQEYNNKQPDKIELEKGMGLSEGWRSENAKRRYSGKSEDITAHNDVTGIPWKVTSSNGREDVIVGAKVSDSYDGEKRQLTLHKSDGTMSFSPFAKNDKEKENRAKRLVKEITQGKSQNVNIDDINSMIDSGKLPKPSLNSTGVKGAGGKSVDQQYKDIIASSKHPGRTEEELFSALRRGISESDKKDYNRYSDAIKSGTVPKGYGEYYQERVDRFKPVIDAEDFINERRKKAIKGDYETEEEARVYVQNKSEEKNYKHLEYYDSPGYKDDYDKLKGVVKSGKLPVPLSGIVPSKELRKTLKSGDNLLIKQNTYSATSSGNSPTGYKIVDGGNVLRVGIKNVKVREQGDYMGKPYDREETVGLDKVSHVIRDGKRYKVDDSDSSPNDLGVQEKATTKRRTKKKDFNSHLNITEFGGNNLRRRKSKIAKFAKPGCCCDASKPLRRRKTKQTPRLKRRGTRYA